ncbi:MAG TPA: hypothetical protein VHD36_17515 [Pirellulales bacterium]|nr:hypothetical protein [Pirellulales bacterium]
MSEELTDLTHGIIASGWFAGVVNRLRQSSVHRTGDCTHFSVLNRAMRISWDRAESIFRSARPVTHVWEKQFDYGDEELRRIAATPRREIKFEDLWYYYHDLCYVELQPDVFAHLFPVCLMDWHETLQRGEPCSKGDSEFHRSIYGGRILERMVRPGQRQQVFEFFRDSFLDRLALLESLDVEQKLGEQDPFSWLARLNSLALVAPCVPMIWNAWWSIETPGSAVAALQYCAGLAFFDDENPFFQSAREWMKELGRSLGQDGAAAVYFLDDSYLHDVGWLPENLTFLRDVVTPTYIVERAQEAARRLANSAHAKLASGVVARLQSDPELLISRLGELLHRLENPTDDPWHI